MKQLRGISNQLIVILIATFLFSCQFNSNNAPAAVKKYSEYTDLEKMNLRGEVIGFKNYSVLSSFDFFNNYGMVERSYLKIDGVNFFWINLNVFSKGYMTSKITIYDNQQFSRISYLYDSSNYLLSEKEISQNSQPSITFYKNDSNGYPLEMESSGSKKVYYWNLGKLDSVYNYYENIVSTKIYYQNGRESKRVVYDKTGSVDKKYSKKYVYYFDRFKNDVKFISTNLLGEKDSAERIIIYKGDDLTKYENEFNKILSQVTKTHKSQIIVQDNQDISNRNSNGFFQSGPEQKEKINCSECGGSGQKICEKCYGKGETRCIICNGSGVSRDGRRCIYCSGGYEKCTRCYGKTRVRCDDCGGRGYKSY